MDDREDMRAWKIILIAVGTLGIELACECLGICVCYIPFPTTLVRAIMVITLFVY